MKGGGAYRGTQVEILKRKMHAANTAIFAARNVSRQISRDLSQGKGALKNV